MKSLDALLLEKLANWRPDNARQVLHLDHADSGWVADVEADAVDALGCRLWQLRLCRAAPLAWAAPLAERAGQIAGRVTGLLEPLRLVEVDAERGVAQLRSVGPARRGDDLLYYEVELHADGAANLHRFQGSRSGPARRQVAFVLTHEALAKLVADLTAV
jgi:hypothetical protein